MSLFSEPYRDTPFEKGSSGVYIFITDAERKQHEVELWDRL